MPFSWMTVIPARSIEEHPNNFSTVFQRFKIDGLLLISRNCLFLENEVKFLVQAISPQPVYSSPEKMQTTEEWSTLEDVEDLYSFVRFASYYRRFVPNFSTILSLLTELTKKGEQYQRTPECDHAFRKLGELLSSQPILALPDFFNTAGRFIHDTNTSDWVIVAML